MNVAKGRVGQDPLRRTIYLHLGYENPEDGSVRVVTFNSQTVTPIGPGEAVPERLATALPGDLARAMYEALADHFGHSGNDTRALRRDYDAERKRVDTFIAHLTGGSK